MFFEWILVFSFVCKDENGFKDNPLHCVCVCVLSSFSLALCVFISARFSVFFFLFPLLFFCFWIPFSPRLFFFFFFSSGFRVQLPVLWRRGRSWVRWLFLRFLLPVFPYFSSSVCWVFLLCSSNDFRFNSSVLLFFFWFSGLSFSNLPPFFQAFLWLL